MKEIKLLFFALFLSFSATAQNYALNFNGQDEFLSFTHNDVYNIGNGFTIEAWIYATEWKQESWRGSIVTKDNQGPDRGFAFRCGDNGVLSFVMATENSWQEAVSGQVMNLNQWHHVAAVVDNGSIQLYIDGQTSGSQTYTGTPSLATDLSIHIGSSVGFGERFFSGAIDEVRIWSDARTQAEILDNTTSSFSGMEENLVGYFPMNEGDGTITKDITATGITAQFNAMDNSNWIAGYALPDYDVSVQNIYGIDVINMLDRPVKMTVDIQNTGVESITDIDLAIKINGADYHTETVTATVAAGELYAYEFELPVDLIGLTDPEIEVEASMTNDGNTLNNLSSLKLKTGTVDNIIVSDKVLHNVGESLNTIRMNLPNDLHKYEQMLLNIDLTCPAGGCGPWDVLADLKAITENGTYELARYITPYGIACGGWVVDITDFKSVLGGEVEFQTSITLFTQQGWLLDMSIDLIDNNTTDSYSHLTSLWERDYHVYGDPGINDDLDPIAVTLNANTESSHVRMTITGHGQGNTNNAAEFLEADHILKVNGSDFNTHHLWKSDCPSNPCSEQAGSWAFPRAGWCPGQAVDPYVINTNAVATAGNAVSLDYELQDYTNLLNTGYNNNGHTEPFYKIHSFFIEESATPYQDYHNLVAENVSATVANEIITSVVVDLTNDGFENLDGFAINIFVNNELVTTETYNEIVAVDAMIQKVINLNTAIDISATNVIFAEVVNGEDDNQGDNITKEELEVIVGLNDISQEYKIEMFPNPTKDGQLFLQYDNYWSGSIVKIYATNGTLVKTFNIEKDMESFDLAHQGMYWYTIVHPVENQQVSGKIIFTE